MNEENVNMGEHPLQSSWNQESMRAFAQNPMRCNDDFPLDYYDNLVTDLQREKIAKLVERLDLACTDIEVDGLDVIATFGRSYAEMRYRITQRGRLSKIRGGEEISTAKRVCEVQGRSFDLMTIEQHESMGSLVSMYGPCKSMKYDACKIYDIVADFGEHG